MQTHMFHVNILPDNHWINQGLIMDSKGMIEALATTILS